MSLEFQFITIIINYYYYKTNISRCLIFIHFVYNIEIMYLRRSTIL